jgi:spermidine synthase
MLLDDAQGRLAKRRLQDIFSTRRDEKRTGSEGRHSNRRVTIAGAECRWRVQAGAVPIMDYAMTDLMFHPSPGFAYGFPGATLVATADTPFQRIEVWDTPQLGRLFALDGRPMTSIADEHIYHECMAHPAALAHPAPRHALVLGGGDGGAAKQLLKHPSIERVVVAELDAKVIELTRAWLPEVHAGALDDARVEVVIGDAAQYVMHAAKASFDLVIFDLTPPDSPAATLYTSAFLHMLKAVLTPQALVTLHLGAPLWHAERVAGLLAALRGVFRHVRPLAAHVPLYGAWWMMAIASDATDPGMLPALQIANRVTQRRIGELKHYDAQLHPALFALPLAWRERFAP